MALFNKTESNGTAEPQPQVIQVVQVKKPFYKRGWFIALMVLIVLAAIGGAGSNSSKKNFTSASASNSEAAQGQAQEAAPAASEPDYVITNEAADTSNSFGYKVTGILENKSGKDRSYVQVSYVLYDADGNQIGTAWDNTSNLKAGGTWRFEAVSLESPEDVASFELAEVTGF